MSCSYPPDVFRVIYGLVASQVGDFENELALGSGGTSTPAAYIKSQYGYSHDYLGESFHGLQPFLLGQMLNGNPLSGAARTCHILLADQNCTTQIVHT